MIYPSNSVSYLPSVDDLPKRGCYVDNSESTSGKVPLRIGGEGFREGCKNGFAMRRSGGKVLRQLHASQTQTVRHDTHAAKSHCQRRQNRM